jgi:hypothetical protein
MADRSAGVCSLRAAVAHRVRSHKWNVAVLL